MNREAPNSLASRVLLPAHGEKVPKADEGSSVGRMVRLATLFFVETLLPAHGEKVPKADEGSYVGRMVRLESRHRQRDFANTQTATTASSPANTRECIAVEARRIAARSTKPAKKMHTVAATASLVAVCGRIRRL